MVATGAVVCWSVGKTGFGGGRKGTPVGGGNGFGTGTGSWFSTGRGFIPVDAPSGKVAFVAESPPSAAVEGAFCEVGIDAPELVGASVVEGTPVWD